MVESVSAVWASAVHDGPPRKASWRVSEPASRPWARRRSQALCSSLQRIGQARSGGRQSGGSTWLWPMDLRAETRSGISSPRSRCHRRSPNTPPHTPCSTGLGTAHRCATVWMPAACRRVSMLRAMPVRSRSSRACRTSGRSRCSMMNSPSGLRILLAIFARYLLGPAPMLTLMTGETSRATRLLDPPADGFRRWPDRAGCRAARPTFHRC